MDVRGRPLHVGIQLRAQHSSWSEFSDALHAVEEPGFDSAWTFDHLLPFSGPDDGAAFETLTTLAAMATLTSRVRLGVLVAGVLYRDPATLAKSAALVDHISAGRLEFPLGAAWARREFDAYGLPFPALAEPYERLEEALQIVEQLWSRPRTTFQGKHFRLHEAPREPKPVQSPHPPITIGGSGAGTLRIAARHADRWNAQGSPNECAERAARLQQCCRAVGRDFSEIELSVHPSVSVAATCEQAEEAAARVAAGHGVDLAQQRERWLIGTPEQVAQQMRAYTERGFSHFVFGVGHPFDLAPLRLLQQEVLPALA